jgi:hypothetical protein
MKPVKAVRVLNKTNAVPFNQRKETLSISTAGINIEGPDTILVVELK